MAQKSNNLVDMKYNYYKYIIMHMYMYHVHTFQDHCCLLYTMCTYNNNYFCTSSVDQKHEFFTEDSRI